ncbi:hypothetical protein QBC32DRAFT_24536 [Pseudoneurospora amorphoporcata]|uniref:Uncharacterized protein n=1 Tax=Pseudoneurospora amorphoporcata TaxID=241081 RepID=A0AAN6SD99_9PEZI|nr:hypothetical protein QBC32DRAFT_24536 [Pseudoneurospora amorphoporcata]
MSLLPNIEFESTRAGSPRQVRKDKRRRAWMAQRQLPNCSSRNSLKLNRIEGTSYLIQVPGQVMCGSFDRSPLWRTPPFATGQARIKMGARKLCLWRTLFAGMTPWTGKEQDVTWREEGREGGRFESLMPGSGSRSGSVSCRVVSCSVVLAIEAAMWALVVAVDVRCCS